MPYGVILFAVAGIGFGLNGRESEKRVHAVFGLASSAISLTVEALILIAALLFTLSLPDQA